MKSTLITLALATAAYSYTLNTFADAQCTQPLGTEELPDQCSPFPAWNVYGVTYSVHIPTLHSPSHLVLTPSQDPGNCILDIWADNGCTNSSGTFPTQNTCLSLANGAFPIGGTSCIYA